jgi:hypothetical protein
MSDTIALAAGWNKAPKMVAISIDTDTAQKPRS